MKGIYGHLRINGHLHLKFLGDLRATAYGTRIRGVLCDVGK